MSRAEIAMIVLVLGTARAQAQDATFNGLGDLPGGSFGSLAYDVSADGSVVVGVGTSANGFEAYRWTVATAMVGLGDIAGGSFQSEALGVSADGNVVVGYGVNSAGDREPFRWTTAGMVSLGGFPDVDPDGEARGASSNGSVVVGFSDQAFAQNEAFRWSGNMGGLGFLGGFDSGADDVSADGSVVVGWAENSAGVERPVRWLNGDIEALGDLPGGDEEGEAWAVSADGSTAVGFSSSSTGDRAFRWTPVGGMQALGSLPGDLGSQANGVSGDGSVIVGEYGTATGPHAFIWTATDGMRDLRTVLVDDYDLNLDGWVLTRANAVSDDGTTIVGVGTGPGGTQAWRAVLPNTCAASFAVRTWQNSAGGGFAHASNWSDGAVPGTGDRAHFELGEVDYTVDFVASHINQAARVGGGNHVRFALGGQLYELYPSAGCSGGLSVGSLGEAGSPRLEIENGGVAAGGSGVVVSGVAGTALRIREGGSLTLLGGLFVGLGATADADVVVESGGSLVTLGDPQSKLGIVGTGRLTVEGGATATLAGVVHLAEGDVGTGRARAVGTGAALNLPGRAVVGYAGRGFLNAQDNAVVTVGDLTLGRLAGSEGIVSVSTGGTVEARDVLVGVDGNALVTVDGLASLLVDRGIEIPGGPTSGEPGEVSASGIGAFVRAGIIRLGARGPGVLRVGGGSIVQAGQLLEESGGELDLAGGCLIVGGGECQTALAGVGGVVEADTVWLSPGAMVDSASVALGAGGVLGGAGMLDLDLTNAGAINPGDSAGVAGTFTIGGAYTQAAGGALEIELGGTAAGAWDHLTVTGSAALDGTLRFSHINGFTPAPGDVFEVLSAASISGTFGSVEGPAGSTYSLDYGPSSVTATVLTVANEPPAGAAGLALHQPAPNPASGRATIRFELPTSGHVRMTLHDGLGREVAILVDDVRPAGLYDLEVATASLSPGPYFARIHAGEATAVRALTVSR